MFIDEFQRAPAGERRAHGNGTRNLLMPLLAVVGAGVDARRHGPLPLYLIGLTVVTGLVDAFSYLALGHVFVANMTGNVVFLGFALAGVGDVSATASLLALAAFAAGAALGGHVAVRSAPHRGRLLATVTAVQATVVLAAAVAATTTSVDATPTRLALTGLLAVAMGGQGAVARRLAIPDLPTTVLTSTVTGLAADTAAAAVHRRRGYAIAAMLAGAAVGGALLRWAAAPAPLWAAATVLTLCAAGAYGAARRRGSDTWR